ncbi:MAG: hypothetical protein K8R60_07400 [Burkholderiales bacterium]|nr:hypothetical protein [Burkholderiales bacterium]
MSRAHDAPHCSSPALTGALGLREGVFTLAPLPDFTAAPLWKAHASR